LNRDGDEAIGKQARDGSAARTRCHRWEGRIDTRTSIREIAGRQRRRDPRRTIVVDERDKRSIRLRRYLGVIGRPNRVPIVFARRLFVVGEPTIELIDVNVVGEDANS
jgi:hypothetical protein